MLPCSSIQPAATVSSVVRWRCNGVRIPPGCKRERPHAGLLAERVKLYGNSAFAVFAWP